MVDLKVKDKIRNKVNKLVEERKKECPEKDENTIRGEVTNELREKRKANKKGKHADIEKIKEEVKTKMGDSDKKAVDKAISRAVAKHYSQLKKAKMPSQIRKEKANSLISGVNSELWCPKEKAWFDDECIQKFDELQLLAAMVEINLLKAPQNFGKLFPHICKEYFDFLAKKRFNSSNLEEVKPGMETEKVKKSTSSLQKKFEEKKALNPDQTKSPKVLLGEVLSEVSKREKEVNLKNIRKSWRPSHKPWFDGECQEAYKSLKEKAENSNLDLDNNPGDYRKFKLKNKEACKQYFILLETKRKDFDVKQTLKKEMKETATAPKDVNIPAVQDMNTVNKKIKFTDDDEESKKENNISNSNESDLNDENVDKTIKKVDNKLKKLKKNESKKKTSDLKKSGHGKTSTKEVAEVKPQKKKTKTGKEE